MVYDPRRGISELQGAYGRSPFDPNYDRDSQQQANIYLAQNPQSMGFKNQGATQSSFRHPGGTSAEQMNRNPFGMYGSAALGMSQRAPLYSQGNMTQEQIDAMFGAGGPPALGNGQVNDPGYAPQANQGPGQQMARAHAPAQPPSPIQGNRAEIDKLRTRMAGDQGNDARIQNRIQYLQRQNQNTRIAQGNERFGQRADELNQAQDRLNSFKNPNNDPALAKQQERLRNRVGFLSRMQNNTRNRYNKANG